MAVLEKLRQMLPELSKSERKAADFLLNYPQEVRRLTCDGLASECSTSRSAVIRLSQKLGYQGYSEFRFALLNEPRTEPAASGQDTLQLYLNALQGLRPLVGSPTLGSVADAVAHANRVVTLGNLHSGVSAQQMAFRLNRFGIDSHALLDSSLMESYENILKQGDVVIIFSISGAPVYQDLALHYRKNRARVVLVTMSPTAPLVQMVDDVIVLPRISKISPEHLLDDAITFFCLIELLIEAIHRKLQQMKGEPETPALSGEETRANEL